jgi:hypothetical protein
MFGKDSLVRLVITARDATANAFNKVDKRIGGLKRAAGALKIAFLGAFGGGAATASAVLKQQIDFADQLDKIHDKLDVTAESMSQLAFVADKSNISFSTLEKSLQKSAQGISEAAKGTGSAREAIDELGLSAEKLNQLAPDQQLLVLARAFEQVEIPADRLRLAIRLFGEEGADMVRILELGGDGLARAKREADALGVTISTNTAKSAAELKDQMAELSQRVQILGRNIAADAVGPMNRIADAMNRAYRDGGALRAVWVGLGGAMAELIKESDVERLEDVDMKLRALEFRIKDLIRARKRFLFPISQDEFLREVDQARELQHKFMQEREQIAASIRRQNERIERARKEGVEGAIDAGKATVSAEEKTNEGLRKELAAREKIYRQHVDRLQQLQQDQKTIAEEFATLVEDIQQGKPAQGDKPLDFLDVSTTKYQAEKALSEGDMERAIDLARKAGDQLRELKEQGDVSGAALTGLAKQIEAVANAATQARIDVEIVGIERERAKINDLRKQLKKDPLAMSVEISEAEPEASRWARTRRLAELIDDFEANYWPDWKLLQRPPAGASRLRIALFEAFATGCVVPRSPRRLSQLMETIREPDF